MNRLGGKTLYRRLFLTGITIAGLYFLYRIRIILVPFVFAVLIAYLLNPLVLALEKRKISRLWSLIIVYILVFGIAGFVIFAGVPRMIAELNHLVKAVPVLAKEIYALIGHMEKNVSSFHFPQALNLALQESIQNTETQLVEMIRSGTGKIMKALPYIAGLLISPLFAFYMLKDLEMFKESFMLTIPRKYRNDIMALLRDFDEIISGFLRGNIITSFIVGALTGIGMYIIGTDFAILIGIIAGITEMIPYLGPFISAVPAIGLALLISKKTAFYAFLVIMVVQQLENAVIAPKILGTSLGLHPLTVIFVLLAGGELFGFVGLLIAVPVASAIKVTLRYVFLKLVDEK